MAESAVELMAVLLCVPYFQQSSANEKAQTTYSINIIRCSKPRDQKSLYKFLLVL